MAIESLFIENFASKIFTYRESLYPQRVLQGGSIELKNQSYT